MAQPALSYHACLRRSLLASLALRTAARSFTVSACKRHPDSDIKRYDDPNKKAARQALIAQGASKQTTTPNNVLPEKQLRSLKQELRWLTDPLRLAEHVRYVLEHDDADKAYNLIKLSSRAVANVVSWNHLLDYYMRNGKTRAAFDVYNDMKKRGQKPDSYTYLLLLRGLADHAQHPHSLGRALSLYHSMSAPGNKVSPTIRHTNAVLKVCARANDMDSLWDIASRLPDHGPHAADYFTFTTILNNIRLNALTGGAPEDTAEDTAKRKNEAILQGRRLWHLVAQRWRAGDIKIDEELTCSMGRLLLIGSRPQDWDDVLSLVEQTMRIPRAIPRLGTEGREELPPIRAPHTPADLKKQGLADAQGPAEFSTDAPVLENDMFADTGTSNTSFQPPALRSQMDAYARPGNSTLSLLLEACLKMITKKSATQYWNVLTDPTKTAVVPDLDNFHMRLRILRLTHSSAEVLTLLRDDLPAAKVKPVKKTFAIAMAACARDSRNPSAVDSAGKVLDIAMQRLGEPSAKTFLLYLDTVTSVANVIEKTPPSSTSGVDSDGLENLRTAVRIQLRALGRLEPGTVALKSMLNFGTDPKQRPSNRSRIDWDDEVKRERTDATELMKRMIAVYDRVVGICQGREREMGLGPSNRRTCVEQKKKLQAFVTRMHERGVKRVIASRGWRGVNKATSEGLVEGRRVKVRDQ